MKGLQIYTRERGHAISTTSMGAISSADEIVLCDGIDMQFKQGGGSRTT